MRAAILALAALPLAMPARSQSPDLTSKFFEDAKGALLANGQRVNCCGPADGVKVRVTRINREARTVEAVIIDIMRSVNGKVGDAITAPLDLMTIEIESPFAEPVAFIRGDLSVICFAGRTGG
jgi:hypothetical protein